MMETQNILRNHCTVVSDKRLSPLDQTIIAIEINYKYARVKKTGTWSDETLTRHR